MSKITVRSEAVTNIDIAIANLKEMRELLILAEAVEWEKPQAPAEHPDDTGIRSKGESHTDPTGETAVDESRLRLRRALYANRSNALALRNAAVGMHVSMLAAYRPYSGDREVF